ncbi:DUF4407 domain-containing protein [Amycolatopsis sp. H20-H5]|uniref:DUF4407 domain-containing protein n=1 Tax=Amycolatopsis sp. H20-H5 TaxID=3046309 RepID=UPI002DB73EE0|nr:DUF4407 domain-containing protein [Amycolatopsis sp. H20-H5]MEC3977426.1 DUF4407 domain-containing protein [Amycolatopsis sp. H20-H5]
MKLLGFIAVIGGADPTDPLESDNAARHFMVGFLIIAVATWAFGASLLTFHSSFHGTWVTAALFAALLAGIVFSIDVLITVSPLKDERARSRFKVLAIRAVVAIQLVGGGWWPMRSV